MANDVWIPLARPHINDSDREAVLEVLNSPFLSMGPKVDAFETAVSEVARTKYAVAVNSGTSGLHLLIRSFGIGEGDEVITSSFSFIASSNCILYERACPVFVDIEPETFSIDPNRIEEAITSKTKAILPVDVFGHPARLAEIRDIADKHGLIVIEDACEALGTELLGVPCGNGRWAHAAVFAFYPNKQITTGEGGCIVTDDEQVAALCRSMRSQGRATDDGW